MRKFRDYMARRNRSIHGWIVLWATALLLYLAKAGRGEPQAVEPADWVFVAWASLILLIAAGEYVKKYTRFYGMNSTSFTGKTSQEELADVARSLSFDAGAYFTLLGKRLLPVQLFSQVVILTAGVVTKIRITRLVFFEVAIAMLPWLCLWMKQMELTRAMTRGRGAGEILLVSVFRVFATFFRVLLVGIAFVMFVFFLIDTFGIQPLLASIDQQDVVRFGFNGDFWMVIAVVAGVGISLLFTDTDKELVMTVYGKVRTGLLAVLLVSLVLSVSIYCHQTAAGDHVRLTKDAITVKKAGNEKNYGFDDVTGYRIYCQNEALQMELSFRDGTKETIFKGASEETEGWRNEYYGDANYADYLVDQFMERGVMGTLEDQEKLEKIISGYDKQIWDAYLHLEERLGK